NAAVEATATHKRVTKHGHGVPPCPKRKPPTPTAVNACAESYPLNPESIHGTEVLFDSPSAQAATAGIVFPSVSPRKRAGAERLPSVPEARRTAFQETKLTRGSLSRSTPVLLALPERVKSDTCATESAAPDLSHPSPGAAYLCRSRRDQSL